ncbi:MAG: hypothetical protein JJ992_30055, partial [Planctomycetes bacterium]|nr:hypothetical protein [Planctomycetota bacterium]
QISSGILVNPRVDLDSGVEAAFALAEPVEPYGIKKGLIISYPDKLKVRAGETQTTAPLYFVANFAEFDLPRRANAECVYHAVPERVAGGTALQRRAALLAGV